MRDRWQPAAPWQAEQSGFPSRKVVLGNWECSVRTDQLSRGYYWHVKRKGWLADWEHDAGFAKSLEEAMYEAEIALQRVSGLPLDAGAPRLLFPVVDGCGEERFSCAEPC